MVVTSNMTVGACEYLLIT